MIKGGFILQARKIDSSDLALKPPHVREVFGWLCRKARFKDGNDLKRGQVRCTYRAIQEGLSWNVGARLEMYEKHQIQTALKVLRKKESITTTRTKRGLIITICNYDHYQDSRNYVNSNDSNTIPSPAPLGDQTYIGEECNHDEHENEDARVRQERYFPPPTLNEVKAYALLINANSIPEMFYDYYESVGWMRGNQPIVNWKAAFRLWEARESDYD